MNGNIDTRFHNTCTKGLTFGKYKHLLGLWIVLRMLFLIQFFPCFIWRKHFVIIQFIGHFCSHSHVTVRGSTSSDIPLQQTRRLHVAFIDPLQHHDVTLRYFGAPRAIVKSASLDISWRPSCWGSSYVRHEVIGVLRRHQPFKMTRTMPEHRVDGVTYSWRLHATHAKALKKKGRTSRIWHWCDQPQTRLLPRKEAPMDSMQMVSVRKPTITSHGWDAHSRPCA